MKILYGFPLKEHRESKILSSFFDIQILQSTPSRDFQSLITEAVVMAGTFQPGRRNDVPNLCWVRTGAACLDHTMHPEVVETDDITHHMAGISACGADFLMELFCKNMKRY